MQQPFWAFLFLLHGSADSYFWIVTLNSVRDINRIEYTFTTDPNTKEVKWEVATWAGLCKPAKVARNHVLATLRKIRGEAMKGMKPPFRFAGKTITDTESKEGMTLGLTLEKSGHEHFAEFECSQICYYDISGIEKSRRDEWISGLLKNHHYVIYATDPDRAVAFETALLEEGE